MKKITIDRKIWLRGKKMIDQTGDSLELASMLNRPFDGRMCCIGIYLNQCGIAKKDLLDKADPAMLTDSGDLPKQAEWLIERDGEHITSYIDNSEVAGKLMTENDGAAREERIAALFAKHDVEIEFIN